MRRPSHRASRLLLMFVITVIVVFYAAACFLVYQNNRAIQKMENEPVSQEQSFEAQRLSFAHDSEFFRLLAEKLAYYRHRPETIDSLYSLALRKAPSSHQAFFSYAYYTSAKNCCRDQLQYLLQETIRRCPTHPKMHRIAATYFLALNQRDEAMRLIRRSLELDPSSAPELFRMLEASGSDVNTIVRVTPETSGALIQLAHYLTRNNRSSQGMLQNTLVRLERQNLTPEQRLDLADLAWSSGLKDMARNQTALAARDENTRAKAYAQQARMLWNDGKHEEASRMADRAEQDYREEDGLDQAARYALEIAALQHSQGDTAAANQRMLRILNDYPAYAPAHFQMAQFSRSESSELELFYLKKARDLDPENAEYLRVYARRLLETNHLKEAEAAFRELLSTNGLEREAYLGLAQCHLAAGNHAEALQILQQAVQRAITSGPIYLQMGQLYASIGEYDKAALAYLELARLSPESIDAFNLAGDAYMNLGRYPQARDQYRKVLAKDPANKHALEAVTNLQMLGY